MDERGNSPNVPKETPAPSSSNRVATSPPPPPPPSFNDKNKIVSRNANGTVVMTTAPGNEAELQLYRVLQRASLLAYYDTLLEMGGDDVQQLCDAGEEEFLEIMALVGMASKPLHVRRLQKALQEWVTNPGLFQTPLVPLVPSSPGAIVPPVAPTFSAIVKEVPRPKSSPLPVEPAPVLAPCTSPGPSPGSPLQLTPVLLDSQISRLADAARSLVKNLPQFEPKPHNTKKKICRDLENVMTMSEDDPRRMEEIRKYAAIYGRFDCKRKPEKPLTLHEVSVNEAAAQICRFAPALLTRRDELFPLARQVVRDSGYHYSKTQSGFTPMYRTHAHHTRNGDERTAKRARLEPLSPSAGDSSDGERTRRQDRLEAIAEELRALGERTEELVTAAQQVRENNDLSAIHSLQHQMEVVQNKQTQLLLEQSDLLKQPLPTRIYRRNSSNKLLNDSEKPDTDDTDSQLSFSNTSSPSQEIGDSRDSIVDTACNNNLNGNGKAARGKQFPADCIGEDGLRFPKNLANADSYDPFYNENKVQVIAASGGNIIAVANPALSMSPILPTTEGIGKMRPGSPITLKVEQLSP